MYFRGARTRCRQDLASFLQELANNEQEYHKYLAFKTTGAVTPRFQELWMTRRPDWQCRVCEFVSQNRKRQFWEDRSCAYTWGHF